MHFFQASFGLRTNAPSEIMLLICSSNSRLATVWAREKEPGHPFKSNCSRAGPYRLDSENWIRGAWTLTLVKLRVSQEQLPWIRWLRRWENHNSRQIWLQSQIVCVPLSNRKSTCPRKVCLSSWHTRCHHAWISIAGSDPTSWCSFGCFVFAFVFVCCWFFVVGFFCWVCLFVFVVCFVFLVFLLGLHTGLRTSPLPVLLWLSTIDSLAR